MTEPNDSEIKKADRLLSLALMTIASGTCFFFWLSAGEVYYLIACFGFLALAPLWYRSPANFNLLFTVGIGGRLTPYRKFTRVDMLLASVGYIFVLLAICLWLSEWYKA